MGHLTNEQRYTISSMLKAGYSITNIGLTIGRDKSVVSKEIKRNADKRSGEYRYDLAQRKCESRHKNGSHKFSGD